MTDKCHGSVTVVVIVLVFALNGIFLANRVQAQQTRSSYETAAHVPLHSGRGSNYETIATSPKGTQIKVVGKEGYWLKVESKHGGKPGYIEKRDVERRQDRY